MARSNLRNLRSREREEREKRKRREEEKYIYERRKKKRRIEEERRGLGEKGILGILIVTVLPRVHKNVFETPTPDLSVSLFYPFFCLLCSSRK